LLRRVCAFLSGEIDLYTSPDLPFYSSQMSHRPLTNLRPKRFLSPLITSEDGNLPLEEVQKRQARTIRFNTRRSPTQHQPQRRLPTHVTAAYNPVSDTPSSIPLNMKNSFDPIPSVSELNEQTSMEFIAAVPAFITACELRILERFSSTYIPKASSDDVTIPSNAASSQRQEDSTLYMPSTLPPYSNTQPAPLHLPPFPTPIPMNATGGFQPSILPHSTIIQQQSIEHQRQYVNPTPKVQVPIIHRQVDSGKSSQPISSSSSDFYVSSSVTTRSAASPVPYLPSDQYIANELTIENRNSRDRPTTSPSSDYLRQGTQLTLSLNPTTHTRATSETRPYCQYPSETIPTVPTHPPPITSHHPDDNQGQDFGNQLPGLQLLPSTFSHRSFSNLLGHYWREERRHHTPHPEHAASISTNTSNQ
jgi:hypothetical protein